MIYDNWVSGRINILGLLMIYESSVSGRRIIMRGSALVTVVVVGLYKGLHPFGVLLNVIYIAYVVEKNINAPSCRPPWYMFQSIWCFFPHI